MGDLGPVEAPHCSAPASAHAASGQTTAVLLHTCLCLLYNHVSNSDLRDSESRVGFGHKRSFFIQFLTQITVPFYALIPLRTNSSVVAMIVNARASN